MPLIKSNLCLALRAIRIALFQDLKFLLPIKNVKTKIIPEWSDDCKQRGSPSRPLHAAFPDPNALYSMDLPFLCYLYDSAQQIKEGVAPFTQTLTLDNHSLWYHIRERRAFWKNTTCIKKWLCMKELSYLHLANLTCKTQAEKKKDYKKIHKTK